MFFRGNKIIFNFLNLKFLGKIIRFVCIFSFYLFKFIDPGERYIVANKKAY